MKQKFLIILALFMAISTVDLAYGQDKPAAQQKKEARKAKRVAEQEQYKAAVKAAVELGSFTFSADYLSTGSSSRIALSSGYRTMIIEPSYVNVRLPYFSTSRSIATTPLSIDFQTADFTYTVDNSSGAYYVTIKVKNVRNNQSARKVQSGDYRFDFMISPATGNTTLTVTPTFMAPITYYGSLLIGDE